MKKFRQHLCVDFDGVIHRYIPTAGKAHDVQGEPINHALAWLWKMIQDYDIAIVSARSRSWRARRAMRRWLKKHANPPMWYGLEHTRGLKCITFPKHKPIARLYIDDRAWRFEGPQDFPTKAQIEGAHSWTDPRPESSMRHKSGEEHVQVSTEQVQSVFQELLDAAGPMPRRRELDFCIRVICCVNEQPDVPVDQQVLDCFNKLRESLGPPFTDRDGLDGMLYYSDTGANTIVRVRPDYGR